MKKLSAARKAYKRKWYRKNRAKISAARKAHYQAHKAETIAKVRAWKAAHPDKVMAYKEEWNAEHPEKVREIWRASKDRYRTRKAIEETAKVRNNPGKASPAVSRLLALAEAKATQAAYGIQRVAYQ